MGDTAHDVIGVGGHLEYQHAPGWACGVLFFFTSAKEEVAATVFFVLLGVFLLI